MHAAYHETQGGLEVLRYGELPDPEPGPNDVLIRVHASSMDRLDVYTREGSHGQTVRGPRAIGGSRRRGRRRGGGRGRRGPRARAGGGRQRRRDAR